MKTKLWDPDNDYQRITLHGLRVKTSVGLFDSEKGPGKEQEVIVDVDLFTHKIVPQENDSYIDYDRVYKYITSNWPERPHTDLLESLLGDLTAFCFEDRSVEACRIHIQKPEAYTDAIAGVEIYRTRK